MFQVNQKILLKYADVIVNFALGSGKGIKKNEVVYMVYESLSKPLALEVYKKVLEAGGHPISKSSDQDFTKLFYSSASDKQLSYFAKKYVKGLVDNIDHRINIIGDEDPLYLQSIDPKKLMLANKNNLTVRKWLNSKEDKGKFTWTIALYGTPGMAKEAGLTLEEYWNQIIKACYLDKTNPIQTWKQTYKDMDTIINKLDCMNIQKIHLKAEKTDLWITLGEKRRWMGGSGRNVPSFEIFTSPDWRGTNGHIFFDYPLYRYGNIIKNISLEFKDGKVIKAKAEKNQKLLEELINQENADKIGEFSLTDVRFSHINKFMATTLYDENYGGNWGNTHLALGTSYNDTYSGNPNKMTPKKWRALGFNKSIEHTDIMATTNRVASVILSNGKERIIYKDGKFVI